MTNLRELCAKYARSTTRGKFARTTQTAAATASLPYAYLAYPYLAWLPQ
jgi:hypothetical protein